MTGRDLRRFGPIVTLGIGDIGIGIGHKIPLLVERKSSALIGLGGIRSTLHNITIKYRGSASEEKMTQKKMK